MTIHKNNGDGPAVKYSTRALKQFRFIRSKPIEVMLMLSGVTTSKRSCIVIGASAGGFEVVVDIASRLSRDLPAPVFVTMHVPACHPSYLPSIFSNSGKLRALHPEDGRRIEPGFIYLAPPDHHLLVDDSHIAVNRGPEENGFLPAPMHYSAPQPTHSAQEPSAWYSPVRSTMVRWDYGPPSARGGTAIVQPPLDAAYASMPRSALESVDADYNVRASEIMGGHIQEAGDSEQAGIFFAKARDFEKSASQLQKLAMEQERLGRENLESGKSEQEQ